MAQESQEQSTCVRGRSISEGLHLRTPWNIPETERPLHNCCSPWQSSWLFHRGCCPRLEVCWSTACPEAILCPWAWQLSPEVMASVPTKGTSDLSAYAATSMAKATHPWDDRQGSYLPRTSLSLGPSVSFYVNISHDAMSPKLCPITFEMSYEVLLNQFFQTI